jgi:lipid II:glycine glycyltransferase (peptidoglycan interpeptide bridge formation enzyme)
MIQRDMMLETERKAYFFKIKEIWFSDYPFDVKGYDGVIFRECKNNVDVPGFRKEEFTTLVIDLTQELDQIFMEMSASYRKAIRRAEKNGIVVKNSTNYDVFYDINQRFRKQKKLSSYDGGVDVTYMEKYGTLFTAEIEGEIVAGYLDLEDEKNIRGLIGASLRFEADKDKMRSIADANKLMTWEEIKYAKAKGLTEYDMGGYYTGTEKDEEKERINYFKQGFGGKVVTHYIYQKDYSVAYKMAKSTHKIIQKMKYGKQHA